MQEVQSVQKDFLKGYYWYMHTAQCTFVKSIIIFESKTLDTLDWTRMQHAAYSICLRSLVFICEFQNDNNA